MLQKKIAAFLLIISFCLTVFASSVMPTSAATTIDQDREQLKEIQKDYNEAKSQRQQIQQQINSLLANKNDITDQKNYIEYEIGYLVSEIDALGKLITGYDEEISRLEKEIDTLNSEIDTYASLISDIIKYTYIEGEPSVIELLLSSESLTSFLSKIEFASYMVDYNEKLINDLSGAVTDLDKSKLEHETASQKLIVLQQDNETLKEEYEKKQVELNGKIKELEKNLSQAQYLYQQKQAAEQQITQDIANLQKQIKEKEVYVGAWFRPLPYSYKRISSDFGQRVIFGKSEHHNGIDLPAPIGTSIHAVQSGTVVLATYNPNSYGWYVVIDHGGGVSTLYGHCSKLFVSEGDKVLKGSVIGLVGSTGRSTGPHLHLGLMKDGNWINPETPGYFDAKGMNFTKDYGA